MLFNMRHEVVGQRLDFPRVLAASGLLSSTGSGVERHWEAVRARRSWLLSLIATSQAPGQLCTERRLLAQTRTH